MQTAHSPGASFTEKEQGQDYASEQGPQCCPILLPRGHQPPWAPGPEAPEELGLGPIIEAGAPSCRPGRQTCW